MSRRPLVVSGAITALIFLGIVMGLTNAAQANPNPSTTPSVSPTIGATGLYMFAQDSGTVSLRQVNTTDGDASLAYPQSSMMTTLTGAAQNPATGEVWTIRQDCRLFKVNMTTGSLTSTPPTVLQPTYTCKGIAFDNTGQMFVIVTNTTPSPTESKWAIVDQSTGFYATYGVIRDTMSALTFDPQSGRVILMWQNGNPTALSWININPSTHVETTLAPGLGNQHSNLAFSPTGRLYVIDSGVLKTAINAASIASLTDVGYTSSIWPLDGTLFWYTAPSTSTSPSSSSPTGSNPELANTGTAALGPILISLLSVFAGFVLLALVPVIRRKK